MPMFCFVARIFEYSSYSYLLISLILASTICDSVRFVMGDFNTVAYTFCVCLYSASKGTWSPAD